MNIARVNAVNRTVLVLMGLVLIAAGVGGLLLSLNLIVGDTASLSVIPKPLARFRTGTWWLPWAAAAAGVLLAVLGMCWLRAQFRVDWPTQLDLTGDRPDGHTTLSVGALTDAIEDDAESILGVTAASASLRSRPTHRLDLTVDLAAFADIAEVRRQLQQQTATRTRQVIDKPAMPIWIDLRPTRRERRLVQ